MDHLNDAKMYARQAEGASIELMLAYYAQLATAHALIAWVEQMRQATEEDAETAAMRAELARFHASRNAVEEIR